MCGFNVKLVLCCVFFAALVLSCGEFKETNWLPDADKELWNSGGLLSSSSSEPSSSSVVSSSSEEASSSSEDVSSSSEEASSSSVALCGTVEYDPETEACCGSGKYTLSTEFCLGDTPTPLCGGSTFTATEFCLGDTPTPLCGGNTFTATEFCLGDTPTPLCGGSTFTATEFCLGDTPYAKCGGTVEYNPSTEACCGTGKYTLSTHFCSGTTVHDKKEAADAEAAKITGFTAGINNASNLVFNATGYSSLTSGTTLALVDIKTGAAIPGATTDLGASLSAGALSLNTKKTVDAASLDYVGVTFTATLNGVTSDPVTLDISALFGATTTAGKLRTDKAKFTGMPNTGVITAGFTGDRTVLPAITLSSGVSVQSTIASFSAGCGVAGNTTTVFAVDGGNLTVNYSQALAGACAIVFNIPLNCAGTVYVISDFFIATLTDF